MPPDLYSYFRSSASYRVRIALNLKGIAYQYKPVHLNRGGGEQFKDEFGALNPQRLVPVFQDGLAISQSLAIIEHLDENYPGPELLPRDSAGRAYVRSLALHIACDIHPLNNLRVLKYLTGPMGLPEDAKSEWIRHWIAEGLEAVERTLANSGRSGRFCWGDLPTMADCCLVPQVSSAQRFKVDLSPYPTVMKINATSEQLDAFVNAHPSRQPDAES
jgi:maleylpyruvate isomerase